jgi:hypothetical protein
MIPKQVCRKGRIVSDKSIEGWIWKNKRALVMVQEGLDEAAQRRHAKPPNLAAATKLAAKISG